MDPGSQGVQGCPSPGMAERGEGSGGCNRGDGLPPGPGNGSCNRSDGLPPVPGTPSQQGSSRSQGSGMDGWTNTGSKYHAPAATATATASKCVTECTGMCEHDKPGCKWSRVIRCRDVNKETCP